MAMSEVSAELNRAFARMVGDDPELRRLFMSPDGEARHQLWACGDGWIVGYTTQRITGGRFDGRFATMAYKPVGRGARSGKATNHVRVYFRGFNTRKAARARADRMYEQHRKA